MSYILSFIVCGKYELGSNLTVVDLTAVLAVCTICVSLLFCIRSMKRMRCYYVDLSFE